MTGPIILAAIIAFPVVLGLIFRVSTSHIFFSLMAGELLGRYFGHDVENQAKAVAGNMDFHGYGEIALLVLPMILTAIFLKGSISRGKTVLHVVPLIVTGVIFAAFLIPILPQNIQDQIEGFSLGAAFMDLNKAIIGAMIAVQLISLWLLNRKSHEKKHKSKE